jgi:hypothetical protein
MYLLIIRLVYNCRTSNSWESDLAMSATHYPISGLTYAIVYGCTIATEKMILRKLQLIGKEAAHPLVMPGLFAELELNRHTRLVEAQVTDVETKILELNIQSGGLSKFRPADIDRRNEAKRTAWLDLTYLRNSIITWNGQLEKMTMIAKRLSAEYASQIVGSPQSLQGSETTAVDDPTIPTWINTVSQTIGEVGSTMNDKRLLVAMVAEMGKDVKIPPPDIKADAERNMTSPYVPLDGSDESGDLTDDPTVCLHHMVDISRRVENRLCEIQDEYDEKIRDCTMRVDGMAMATQWVSL